MLCKRKCCSYCGGRVFDVVVSSSPAADDIDECVLPCRCPITQSNLRLAELVWLATNVQVYSSNSLS